MNEQRNWFYKRWKEEMPNIDKKLIKEGMIITLRGSTTLEVENDCSVEGKV